MRVRMDSFSEVRITDDLDVGTRVFENLPFCPCVCAEVRTVPACPTPAWLASNLTSRGHQT